MSQLSLRSRDTTNGAPLPPKGEYLSRWFVVKQLFHSQRASGLAGKELPLKFGVLSHVA